MKKNKANIVLILVFFTGLFIMLYPIVSDLWNSHTQSRAIADYQSVIQDMMPEDYTELFQAADVYNSQLKNIEYPLVNYDQIGGYEDILRLPKTDVMGTINIEKIGVKLPIYHGTSEGVLNVAVGHIQGSSFPVGGEGTHAVLSAHRGLPSAKLFSNLDKMEVGDTFMISVLDRVLTYKVDQVLIVKPEQTEALAIEEGRDYCTLLTCTPYGINTHRLLVRGHRVETVETADPENINGDASQIEPIRIAPLVAAPILLLLLAVLLMKHRKKR